VTNLLRELRRTRAPSTPSAKMQTLAAGRITTEIT
jgi:hypothetical protein